MRRQVDGLDHLADRALLNELAGVNSRTHFQALRVHDGEFAPGVLDRLADLGELFERGNRRLVTQVILASLHGANAERRAQVGNRRAEDELDGLVEENLVLAARQLYVAEFLAVLGDLRRILREERHQLATATLNGAGHAVDVRVVESDSGKPDVMRRDYFGLRCVCGVDSAGTRYTLRQRRRRHPRKHSRESRGLQKVAPVRSCHFVTPVCGDATLSDGGTMVPGRHSGITRQVHVSWSRSVSE